MIEIDGSIGGGQILRTALGLSAVTGKPFKMINIRSSRPKPGIKVQHLEATKAVAKICDAEVVGLDLGSSALTFTPKKITSGRVKINVGTAGSVGLILQAVLIPATLKKIRITIEGGATYGKWSVPMDNLWNVVFPMLGKMGYNIRVRNVKQGFYPKGGAKVEIVSEIAELRPIEILEKGTLQKVKGISIASSSLQKPNIAERQEKAAKYILSKELGEKIDIITIYQDTACPGSGITVWAECENTIISGDCVGERGKRAEIIGSEAAQHLINAYKEGAVDPFTADQLMVYMALTGSGKIKTSKITEHMKSNAKTIELFLDVTFSFEDNIINCTSQ